MGIGPKFIIAFPILILLLIAAIVLLVLFIKLCIKKPLVAIIPAVILVTLFAAFFILRVVSHQRIVSYSRQAATVAPRVVQSENARAAIWSPGIEEQFEADVYPSEISALRALAPRIVKQVPYVMGETDSPDTIVLFENSVSMRIEEAEILKEALEKHNPEIKCRIEIGRNIGVQGKEVGVRFSESKSGDTISLSATIFRDPRSTRISVSYNDKPWVEDFSNYINSRPNQQLIIARSAESCLSEAEANRQALEDACIQVGPLVINLRDPTTLSANDILESGMILDRFVQSFEGTAGKIWRQALLIDTSAEKLSQLAGRKAQIAREMRISWAKMFISIAGLLVLITVVYVFLNAATKGYYAWSLRIAGIILAAIVIFLLLS